MKVLDGHGIMFVEHGLLKNLDTVNFIMDIKQATLTSKATIVYLVFHHGV